MEAFPTATPWKTRPLGIRFLPCPVRNTHVCLSLVSMMPLWDGVHAWSRCIWLCAGGGGWSPGADVQACSLPPTVGARLLKKLTQLPVPHAFSLPSVSHKEGSCEVTHRQTGLAAPSYALTRRDVIWGHYCLAVGKPNRASSATDL